ncbi:MAG: hypothetical protein J2P57_15235 [Acidimicrobiaceae bacterium]|nr:hypothetical protein [Acidimicrobiaceae bacterium]
MTGASEQQRLADAHWAAVCQLSQASHRRLGVRLWFGTLLVRAGLRLVRPLTVPVLLGTGEG